MRDQERTGYFEEPSNITFQALPITRCVLQYIITCKAYRVVY